MIQSQKSFPGQMSVMCGVRTGRRGLRVTSAGRLLTAAVLTTALAWTAPAFGQLPPCGCEFFDHSTSQTLDLVPPGMLIVDCLQNERFNPTHVAGHTATTEMRHANFFPSTITVTHVCLSLKSPTGLPNELGWIRIRGNSGGLPGSVLHEESFVIDPVGQAGASGSLGQAGFQLVALNTPYTAGNFWLSVEYPSAVGGITHQGTGDRIANDAAVQPVAFGPWQLYNTTGNSAYVDKAPVIRPLHLASAPPCTGATNNCFTVASTPGCTDHQCCTDVCACDPFCCNISWDPNCVGPNVAVPGCSAIDLCMNCGHPNAHDCCAPPPLGGAGRYCNHRSCCETVCAMDPFCCGTDWDLVCTNQALANCPHCQICAQCPAGGISSCGGCGSGLCGSCPSATIAQCGETYCGELAADGTTIDEHWYALTIPSIPGGTGILSLEVETDIPLEIEVSFGTCPSLSPIGVPQVPICSLQQFNFGVPASSTVYLRVRPDVTTGHPCGTNNSYTLRFVDIFDPASGISHCTPTVGCVTCPPGGITSCDPCGTGQCGGCATGAFEPVQCGHTHCGELLADAGVIEEHWYELSIPFLAGPAEVLLEVEADMDVEIEIHMSGCAGNIITAFLVPSCQLTSLIEIVPTPIDLDIVIRPIVATGHPCGGANDYTLNILVVDPATGQVCPTAACPTPAHDECDSALTAVLGLPNPTDFCGATASNPPELHPDCPTVGFGGAGSGDHDLWYEFTSTCTAGPGRLFEFVLIPDPAFPPFDRALGLYRQPVAPACPTSPLDRCIDATAGAPAILTDTLAPGETILLRAGAPGGGAGASGFLMIDYAIPCCWDLNGDCVVNVFDLLHLLSIWGQPCPCLTPPSPCNVFALLDLLAAWGPCP